MSGGEKSLRLQEHKIIEIAFDHTKMGPEWCAAQENVSLTVGQNPSADLPSGL
jgi:hypothetical protein